MESFKIAFFCWESLHSTFKVGGLAPPAATHLAERLALKGHEVHFFTRGEGNDATVNGVHYHYCLPYGGNVIEYCRTMSNMLVDAFRAHDTPPFDILHFHDWHVVEALHVLRDRNTVLSFHSTEYGRHGGGTSAAGGSSRRYRARSGTGATSRSRSRPSPTRRRPR